MPRSRSSACRRRRSSCRASRWGCSGRARSRKPAARCRPRRSCRRPGAPPRSPRQRRPEPRSRSSACRRRRSSCRASRWGCSGRARSRRRSPAVPPTTTILPSAWSATPLAPVEARRSRSSACRRRRSSCRASRWGCSGRARSRRRRAAQPTATILPSALERHPGRPVGAPEVGRLLAVAGEARVERPVGVVAGEREVAAKLVPALPDRDDLAVRLERHPGRPVGGRRSRSSACRRRRSSCRASRRGCSGRARSRRDRRRRLASEADRDDLAVGLERHPVRLVDDPEVGRLLAVAGEARVERAVGVVAGEREVCRERSPAADRDDLAVRLERHPVRLVVAPEVGRLLAVAGEARVERAVRVVAGEREVRGATRGGRRPDRDDLAVALDRHPVRLVEAPEVGRLLAVAGEARVERPVGVVAGEREVATPPCRRPRRSCRRLERHPVRPVGAPEVGRLLAVAGEARVERAVGL